MTDENPKFKFQEALEQATQHGPLSPEGYDFDTMQYLIEDQALTQRKIENAYLAILGRKKRGGAVPAIKFITNLSTRLTGGARGIQIKDLPRE